MRIFPVLLHLLLCLALDASGVAGARAQARMQFESQAMTAMADMPDCHHDAPAKPMPASHDACCDAGHCACPVPAMPVFAGLRRAAAAPDAMPPSMQATPRHRAPHLGDPLRPPIG